MLKLFRCFSCSLIWAWTLALSSELKMTRLKSGKEVTP
jgi:hypothetical protein